MFSTTIGTQAAVAHFGPRQIIIPRKLPSRYFWNLWYFLYCSYTQHLPSRSRHSIYYTKSSVYSVPRKYLWFPLLPKTHARKSWFFWVIAISCSIRGGSKGFWGRRRSKTAGRRYMADTLIFCYSDNTTRRTCSQTSGGRPDHPFYHRETSGYAQYPSPMWKSDFIPSGGPIRYKTSHSRVISFYVRQRRRIRPDNARVLRPTQRYLCASLQRYAAVISTTRMSVAIHINFLGTVRACFERSTLPEHADTRTIVLRILEILSPVSCVVYGYDSYISLPTSGDLLSRQYGKKGDSHIRPWSTNLDRGKGKQARMFSLLWPKKGPNATTWKAFGVHSIFESYHQSFIKLSICFENLASVCRIKSRYLYTCGSIIYQRYISAVFLVSIPHSHNPK